MGRLLYSPKWWTLDADKSLESDCFTSFVTFSELLYVSEVSVF